MHLYQNYQSLDADIIKIATRNQRDRMSHVGSEANCIYVNHPVVSILDYRILQSLLIASSSIGFLTGLIAKITIIHICIKKCKKKERKISPWPYCHFLPTCIADPMTNGGRLRWMSVTLKERQHEWGTGSSHSFRSGYHGKKFNRQRLPGGRY